MTYFIVATLTLNTIFYFLLGWFAREDMNGSVKEAKIAFFVSVVMTFLSFGSLILMVRGYV